MKHHYLLYGSLFWLLTSFAYAQNKPPLSIEVRLTTQGDLQFVTSTNGQKPGLVRASALIRQYEGDELVRIYTPPWVKRGTEMSAAQIGLAPKFDLHLSTYKGDVTFTDVQGSVRGQLDSGAVELSNVQGKAELTTRQGDIKITNSQLKGFLHTASGNIVLQDCPPTIELAAPKGKITFRYTPTYFKEREKDRFQANLLDATLEAETIPANSFLRMRKGAMNIGTLGAGSILLIQERGTIQVKAFEGSAKVINTGGDIQVQIPIQTPEGDTILLSNLEGDVTVGVPKDFPSIIQLVLRQTRDLDKQSFDIKSQIEIGQWKWTEEKGPKEEILWRQANVKFTPASAKEKPLRLLQILVTNGNISFIQIP